MKHALPVALGGGTLLALAISGIYSQVDTHTAWNSTRDAMGYLLVGLVIVWPLCLGAAGMDGVMLARGRIRHVVEALPRAARLGLAVRRVTSLWIGAIIGASIMVLFVITVSWSRGSHPTLMALAGVPLALVGMLAWVLVGWVAGLLTRSWVVPPVLMLAYFMLLMMGNNWSYWWARGAVDVGVVGAYTHPVMGAYAAAITFLSCVTALGGAVLLWWAWRGRLVLSAVVVCGAALAGSSVWLHAAISSPDGYWRYDDMTSWPCASMASGNVLVCVPPDNSMDLHVLPVALAPLQERLAAAGGRDAESRIWRPVDDPPGSSFVYEPLLGRPFDKVEATRTVVGSLGAHCSLATDDQGSVERFFTASDTLALWIDPDIPPDQLSVSGDISQSQAAEAYRTLVSCP